MGEQHQVGLEHHLTQDSTKKKKDKSDTNHNELCYSPGRCHSHWERASKLIEILEQDAATDNQVEVLDHNSRTLERLLWWERRGY